MRIENRNLYAFQLAHLFFCERRAGGAAKVVGELRDAACTHEGGGDALLRQHPAQGERGGRVAAPCGNGGKGRKAALQVVRETFFG